jgi:SHS family lactate transporter-like MFS transporter
MMSMTMSSHGTQDLYPTFLQRRWGVNVHMRSVLTGITILGAVVGGIFVGFLSDRIGRRRAMLLAIGGAMLTIPLWAFAPSLPLLVLGGFIMQFMVQGAWGVVPAYLTELSPAPVRATAPGLAYQLGGLVTSWNGKAQALAAERWGNYPAVLAVTVVVVALALAGLALLGREARGQDMTVV